MTRRAARKPIASARACARSGRRPRQIWRDLSLNLDCERPLMRSAAGEGKNDACGQQQGHCDVECARGARRRQEALHRLRQMRATLRPRGVRQ